ncbi:hypothetical protein QR680_005683 [Steinernema hermaphroditum]|uniref:Piwi domain-containing protein n=1 Tax=Steinernema hermaphroditum TaxID=289476 RepID=A0AA39HUE5_9BILA|nr:hypothetical protein QR680_005683 [Steinernema hermaphroditum]
MSSRPRRGSASRGGANVHGLQTREAQQIRGRNESEYYHQIMNVEETPAIVADQRPPGADGRGEILLQTNVYGLTLKDINVCRYDVHVVAKVGNRDRVVEFTKRCVDDINTLQRRTKCRLCLDIVCNKYQNVFQQRRELVWYDSQSILFTASRLDIGASEKKQFVLEEADLRSDPLFDGIKNIIFEVTPCSEGTFMVNANDIARYASGNMDNIDHSLQQFLEILTAQYALNNPQEAICFGSGTAYLMQPQNHGFRANDCPDLGDGKYLAVGASKAVRFIEGPGGRGGQRPALVVDVKKTAFHYNQSVLDKARMILNRNPGANDLRRLRSEMKGLIIETRHGRRPRICAIHNFTEDTPATKKFKNANNVEVTLVEYFHQSYNITLAHPDTPLIVVQNSNKQSVYYPMELVYVADGQRVGAAQQGSKLIQAMIRQCAIPPAERIRQIASLVPALKLTSDNEYHKAAGLTITSQPLNSRGRLLANPVIRYARGNVLPDASATWKVQRNQYLVPATVRNWGFYVIVMPNRRNTIPPDAVQNFQTAMVQECRARGMDINPPSHWDYLDPVPDVIKPAFESAKANNVPFLFFVSHNDVTELHNVLKLYEREFGIITQDLKLSTALDVVQKGKRQTMENIVNKLNVKNGGMNYSLDLPKANSGKADVLPNDRMVIGLSTSHAGPQTRDAPGSQSTLPSVIGVAANVKTDPLDFVGDCLFQQPRRDEKISIMQPLLRSFINMFIENRGTAPKSIVVYRNGASEGQYKDILDLELLMIRAVARSCGIAPKITMIVSQKMHNLRLMPKNINPRDRPPAQNAPPGTVVDTSVTHPAYNEFYLNGHTALQGSARTPRYTVLHDESDMSMDEVENLTYSLSFAHQIVNLTTSLPSPVYIAMRYAERGLNVFKASPHDYTIPGRQQQQMQNGSANGSPNSGQNGNGSGAPSTTVEGNFDFHLMMRDLSYANCHLRNYRVNA